MSVLGTFRQAPTERKLYNIDYSSWLQSGESISAFSSSVSPSTPAPVEAIDAYSIQGGTAIAAYISGGVSGTLYRIFVTVTTSLGQVKEDEIRINCIDPATQAV